MIIDNEVHPWLWVKQWFNEQRWIKIVRLRLLQINMFNASLSGNNQRLRDTSAKECLLRAELDG